MATPSAPPVTRDDLVAGLHARGVCYLAPTPAGDERPVNDEELILGLARAKDARLRFALSALLLRHPMLSVAVEQVCATPHAAQTLGELRKQYVASMYLQRMWRTRLRLAFGDSPLIPERFTSELRLPSPEVMHGELGLRRLTEHSPYNDWSSYEQVVELLIEQPCAT